jgi:predicted phosphoribosyltransferase
MRFKNRQDAGRRLIGALKDYRGKKAVVFAFSRGGVAVGAELAKKLMVPLDIVITRPVGHPYDPAYAIAAVTEYGDIEAVSDELHHIEPAWFKQAVKDQQTIAQRVRQLYLKGLKPAEAAGQTAIVVADGLATSLTAAAAIRYLRRQKPERIVAVAPVASEEAAKELAKTADEVVVLYVPAGFFGTVSSYYRDFPRVKTEEAAGLLKKYNRANNRKLYDPNSRP